MSSSKKKAKKPWLVLILVEICWLHKHKQLNISFNITSMTKIGSKMELNHIRPTLSWIGWTQSLAKECLPWKQDRGSFGLHQAQIWNLVTSTCGVIWMNKSTSQCQRPYWNSSKRSLKFFFQFLKKMSKRLFSYENKSLETHFCEWRWVWKQKNQTLNQKNQ